MCFFRGFLFFFFLCFSFFLFSFWFFFFVFLLRVFVFLFYCLFFFVFIVFFLFCCCFLFFFGFLLVLFLFCFLFFVFCFFPFFVVFCFFFIFCFFVFFFLSLLSPSLCLVPPFSSSLSACLPSLSFPSRPHSFFSPVFLSLPPPPRAGRPARAAPVVLSPPRFLGSRVFPGGSSAPVERRDKAGVVLNGSERESVSAVPPAWIVTATGYLAGDGNCQNLILGFLNARGCGSSSGGDGMLLPSSRRQRKSSARQFEPGAE